MRRVFGPIVTTGVSLMAAGVVVANPIAAPHSDVRISSIQLSGSTDATGGMLDEAFLNAIAPAPPESTNPFSVLKSLVSALAADATYLGKNAIVDAFVAGVTAVSEPELTAASVPYVATPGDAVGLADLVAPTGTDLASVFDPFVSVPTNLADPAPFITQSLAPAVEQFVSSLASDAGYVGGQLVAAAFAAGAVVAKEPAMIVDTLRALVSGDFNTAIQRVVQVITAPLGPTTMIVDAFVNVFERSLSPVPVADTTPAGETVSAGAPSAAPVAATVSQAPVRSVRSGPAQPGQLKVAALPSSFVAMPNPVAAAVPDLRDALPTATEPTIATATEATGPSAETATPTTPATRVVPVRKPVRDAVKAAADQAGGVARGVADTVGKIAGRSHAGLGGSGSAAN